MDILKFLKAIGMSQTELAEELGVTPSNVNLWVNGKGKPSYNCCKRLLEMGIIVDDLFDFDYNKEHHLVVEDRDPDQIKEDEFRIHWMKMMEEYAAENKAKEEAERRGREAMTKIVEEYRKNNQSK